MPVKTFDLYRRLFLCKNPELRIRQNRPSFLTTVATSMIITNTEKEIQEGHLNKLKLKQRATVFSRLYSLGKINYYSQETSLKGVKLKLMLS